MSIVPAKRTLTIWRGSTFTKSWRYLESIGPPPVPQDITDSTSEIRIFHDDGTEVFECVVTGPEGEIILRLSAVETCPFPNWKHPHYELKLIGPEGVTSDTLLYGAIKFKGEEEPFDG